MGRSMESDPIREAYRLWIENGWGDTAEGCAAVSSILRVNQVLARRADQVLAPVNLTFARYEVLVVLHFNDGSMPLARLGRHLQVHQTSITNLVDKLEAQGLIRRMPHPTDRRSTVAEITTAGRSLLREAIGCLNAGLFASLGLTSEETRLLISVLAKMRHSWGDFKDDQGWNAFVLDEKPWGECRS